ncbi:MAG: PPP family 3-phenylpropionic acid transporter [Porticoccus sp.]|jgi:PPP family 3-phenylpropionic acid transporter
MVGEKAQPAVPYWRLSAFYFCFFGLLGALHPYWSLYLKSEGFSSADIGILLAIPMATKIVAPNLWGWLADYTGKRLLIIRMGALLSFLCFIGLFIDQKFWSIALVLAGYSFFWNAILPQHEVITISFLRQRPETYSRIRLWGSIGFIIFVLGSGFWFDNHDIQTLPVIGLILLAGIFLSSLFVPNPHHQRHEKAAHKFRATIRQPAVLAFLLAGLLMQVSHGIYYSFFSLYMESVGYSRSGIGILWSVGVVAEVFLFILMHRLLLRFGVREIMLGCLFIATLRWLLIGYGTEQLLLLVLAQIFHAFTFGAFHAAAIDCIRRLFEPANQGKAHALYSAFCFGAGGALGSYLGGVTWDIQPLWAFNIGALASFIAMIIVWFWLRDKRLKLGE